MNLKAKPSGGADGWRWMRSIMGYPPHAGGGNSQFLQERLKMKDLFPLKAPGYRYDGSRFPMTSPLCIDWSPPDGVALYDGVELFYNRYLKVHFLSFSVIF